MLIDADRPDHAGLPVVGNAAVELEVAYPRRLDRQKLLWSVDPSSAQVVWASLGPWVRQGPAESGDPRLYQDLEWLAGIMAEMDRRAGRLAITPAAIGRQADTALAYRQELIRTAEAMRTVVIGAPPG